MPCCRDILYCLPEKPSSIPSKAMPDQMPSVYRKGSAPRFRGCYHVTITGVNTYIDLEKICENLPHETDLYDYRMNIRGSILVVGLGSVFALVLPGLFYAGDQQHL